MQLEDEDLARALVPVISHLRCDPQLTPAEREEVVRMAQGLGCRESAAATNVSTEKVRGRRRRIYLKLHVSGMGELLHTLLDTALRMRERVEEAGHTYVAAAAAAVARYEGLRADAPRARTGT